MSFWGWCWLAFVLVLIGRRLTDPVRSASRRHRLSPLQHGAFGMMLLSHQGCYRRRPNRIEIERCALLASQMNDDAARCVYAGIVGAGVAMGWVSDVDSLGENFGETQPQTSRN